MSANSYTVSLLEEVAELIQGYVDVIDGSDGPRPNQAMIAANKLNEAIEFLKATAITCHRGYRLSQAVTDAMVDAALVAANGATPSSAAATTASRIVPLEIRNSEEALG